MYSILFIVLVLWSTSSSLPIPYSKLSPEFIQEEDNTLSQLANEAQKTELKAVWKKSESLYSESTKGLEKKYRKSGTLNEGQIRILISYCYESDFYSDLNEDLRKNGGRRYPVATKVMKKALTKLRKYQLEKNQNLPKTLYRNEPVLLFNSYQNLLQSSKSGVLEQFTSTSTDYNKANNFNTKPGRMVIKFEDPQLGASIADFSTFEECEVLLPVSGVYTVKTATEDGNDKYNVVLIGPRSRISTPGTGNTSGYIKHNSNVFIIFLSVLIIKLV